LFQVFPPGSDRYFGAGFVRIIRGETSHVILARNSSGCRRYQYLAHPSLSLSPLPLSSRRSGRTRSKDRCAYACFICTFCARFVTAATFWAGQPWGEGTTRGTYPVPWQVGPGTMYRVILVPTLPGSHLCLTPHGRGAAFLIAFPAVVTWPACT
jgi:hypothetical protein